MKYRYLVFVVVTAMFFVITTSALAIVDPLAAANNKYGIHVTSEADFQDAANLVNSSGGDWGYVTFVIREDQRDVKQWNGAFNKLRQLHLIPLVRIATTQEGQGWKKMDTSQVNEWAEFFDQLTWVTKNRYVIVGNEPNHNLEWGGASNPIEYANYVCDLSRTLKAHNDDYFIISAGLDASAPSGKTTVSEESFLTAIAQKNPEYFDCIDGWGSHSYPNPNFSGTSTAWGKGSVRTYLWEMEYLKKNGIDNNYPIFITETGWARKISRYDGFSLSETQISQNLKDVAENVWSDNKIVAVTPFILDYQTFPFTNFSWKTADGWVNYATTYQEIPKTNGQPAIINTGEIQLALYPKIVLGNSLPILIEIKNTGQQIWSADSVFVNTDNPKLHLKYHIDGEIWPNENKIVKIDLSDSNSGKIEGNIFLSSGTIAISEQKPISAYTITKDNDSGEISPTPSIWERLGFKVSNLWRFLVK